MPHAYTKSNVTGTSFFYISSGSVKHHQPCVQCNLFTTVWKNDCSLFVHLHDEDTIILIWMNVGYE